MPISVALLLSETDTRQLVELSDDFNKVRQSMVRLGNKALPHITIAQFDAPDSVCEELWGEVHHLANRVDSLVMGGMTFLPQRNSNNLWIEVQVLKSRALAQLHDDVLATKFASKHKTIGAIGDGYRPHCTVALYNDQTIPRIDVSTSKVLRATLSDVTFVVGVNGDNLTFNPVIPS